MRGRHNKRIAAEKRSITWCLNYFPVRKQWIEFVMRAIKKHLVITKNSKILEVGAAQGLSILSLKILGYKKTSGIEPCKQALNVSKKIEKKFNISLNISKGQAEKILIKDCSIDLIIAESVLEHVADDEKFFQEAFRILKKGGGFYFCTSSVVCPIQGEVRFFPIFSWYPQSLKNRIIRWVMKNRPDLVNYTNTPAINWYWPAKIKRMAKEAGFSGVIDRWELFDYKIENHTYKTWIKSKIHQYKILRSLGNLIFPGSFYLLIK